MKRILPFALLLCLVAGLCACQAPQSQAPFSPIAAIVLENGDYGPKGAPMGSAPDAVEAALQLKLADAADSSTRAYDGHGTETRYLFNGATSLVAQPANIDLSFLGEQFSSLAVVVNDQSLDFDNLYGELCAATEQALGAPSHTIEHENYRCLVWVGENTMVQARHGHAPGQDQELYLHIAHLDLAFLQRPVFPE